MLATLSSSVADTGEACPKSHSHIRNKNSGIHSEFSHQIVAQRKGETVDACILLF